MSDVAMTHREEAALPLFELFLQQQRNGELLGELCEAMVEVSEAVKATGNPGEITIVIKIKPDKTGPAVLSISDEVKKKAPKFARGSSIWFALPSGRISRQQHEQRPLEFAR